MLPYFLKCWKKTKRKAKNESIIILVKCAVCDNKKNQDLLQNNKQVDCYA